MKTHAGKTLKRVVTAVRLDPRKVALALCLALCTVGLGFSASKDDPTFITFDAPGAVSTLAGAINAAGSVTGSYLDANNVFMANW